MVMGRLRFSVKNVVIALFLIVLYCNVGYLVSYAFASNLLQTTTTDFVYRCLDFFGIMGRHPLNYQDMLFTAMFWPVLVTVSVLVNSAMFLVSFFWNGAKFVFTWLFHGGLWRWMGLIP